MDRTNVTTTMYVPSFCDSEYSCPCTPLCVLTLPHALSSNNVDGNARLRTSVQVHFHARGCEEVRVSKSWVRPSIRGSPSGKEARAPTDAAINARQPPQGFRDNPAPSPPSAAAGTTRTPHHRSVGSNLTLHAWQGQCFHVLDRPLEHPGSSVTIESFVQQKGGWISRGIFAQENV